MDTPLISEAVSDIILILNFLAFFLVTFYFLLRSDRLYACLERREQSALGMSVGGFIGGSLAIIVNWFLATFLDWYIPGVGPQTSLLFGLLFGVKVGLASGAFSVIFVQLLTNHSVSWTIAVTIGSGALGGLYTYRYGKIWADKRRAIMLVFVLYVAIAGIYWQGGMFNHVPREYLAWVIIESVIMKMVFAYCVMFIVTRIHEERQLFTSNDSSAAELQFARKLQLGLVPSDFAPFAHEYQISAVLRPTREVGGDWYDCVVLPDARLFVAIGDVSDKGAAAALFMANCIALFRSLAESWKKEDSLASVVQDINRELCDNNRERMFVTAVFALLDSKNASMEYVTIGHVAPLIVNDSTNHALPTTCKGVLGINAKLKVQSMRYQLCEHDWVLLCTDGVTEAQNLARQLFGYERYMAAARGQSAQAIVDNVLGAVDEHSRDYQQSDDIALLCLRSMQQAEVQCG